MLPQAIQTTSVQHQNKQTNKQEWEESCFVVCDYV